MEVGSSECAKCAINKAEKSSCCARGGAWFKNCGDGGDTKFDHTWSEGIQACKGIGESVPGESTLQFMSHHAGSILHPTDNIRGETATRQERNISFADIMFNVGSTRSNECIGIVTTVFYTCVLLMI